MKIGICTIVAFIVSLTFASELRAQGLNLTVEEASLSFTSKSLGPDQGQYLITPGIGSNAAGFLFSAENLTDATFTDDASDIDVVGSLPTPGAEAIQVTDFNGSVGDGTCRIRISMSTTGPDLWPAGFQVGGLEARQGGLFLGANAGGSPLTFANDGPVIVTKATIGGQSVNGAFEQDLTHFDSFTAGAGGGWDGSLGVVFSAGIIAASTGLLVTQVEINVSYTQGALCGDLPVELTDFKARASDDVVNLSWSTLSESSNSGFEIQASKSGEFETIGWVDGNGSSTEKIDYSFQTESLSSGMYSFRLKQLDFDGSFEYSEVIESIITFPMAYMIGTPYPNPFDRTSTIDIGVDTSQLVVIEIYNTSGQLVSRPFQGELGANRITPIQISLEGLPSGPYIAAVVGDRWVAHHKLSYVR